MEKGLIAQFHFQEHDLNFWIQLDLYLTMFSFYKPLNNNNKNNYAADNNFLGLDFKKQTSGDIQGYIWRKMFIKMNLYLVLGY